MDDKVLQEHEHTEENHLCRFSRKKSATHEFEQYRIKQYKKNTEQC